MVESHMFPSVSPSYNSLFFRENVFFLFLYSSLKSFQFRSLKVGLTKLDNYSPQGFTGCDEETTGPTRVYRRKLAGPFCKTLSGEVGILIKDYYY